MSAYICVGLDGGNPLHALAAFGLLRLADRMAPGARLGWRLEQAAWRPVLSTIDDPESWSERAAQWLNALGRVGSPDPSLNRRVRELGSEVKKAQNRAKEITKTAKAHAKAAKLDRDAAQAAFAAALAPIEMEIAILETDIAKAKTALAQANGAGIAHLGDIIGVTPSIFRNAAETAIQQILQSDNRSPQPTTDDPSLIAGQLAALGCDQIVDGEKISPTPYSFSNGSSGQCLLKDVRSCMSDITAAMLMATLNGTEGATVPGQTGLNWDPADQRSYALAWDDPASAGKAADAAANALAYLGLGLLPCMPGGRGLQACGWSRDKHFTWPIWGALLPISVVSSLLATPLDRGAIFLRQCGIQELRRSQVSNPSGKRNFFAPSIPIA